MDLDRAIAGHSPIHRADPRLKLALTLAAIVAISLLPAGAFVALALAWMVLIGLSTVAGLGPMRLSRAGVIAVPFFLAALPLVFTHPEEPIAAIGPLTISGEGLRIFATVAVKSWLSVQAALLLTFTTPFHLLVDALRDLRVPRILVAIIGFMYRYLAVLIDEATRLMRARASRSAALEGAAAGGSLGWRARVTGGMAGQLFLRSYERSERIYDAMRARGFEGTFQHLATRSIPGGEWAVFGVVLALLVVFELAGHLWLPVL